MATTQQPNYVTTADGRRITYARWQYEQTVAQEAVMRQVNALIMNQATAAVGVGAGFDQSEFGGLLRNLVPQLLDQYGNINATAAVQYYDAQRLMWAETYGPAASQMASRGNVRAQGTRYATARTQSALAVTQGYAAQFADDYKLAAKADSVINFAMRVRSQQGHEPSVTAMNNALTREVAMYHRDTVLFNAGLDPFVQRVQRVAQAKACEFCRLMALGSTNGTVRTSTYAAKFHSHCHCTIQPLFDGDQPVRPDYYDEFEKEYAAASKGGGSSKEILAQWRKGSGNAQSGAIKPPVPTVHPDAPAKWPWQKGYSADFDTRQQHVALSRTIPLSSTGYDLPRLPKPNTLDEAQLLTNPRFKEGRAFRENCARVVQVYEMRRRGYDVLPNGFRDDLSQVRQYYYQGWRNPETGLTAWEEKLTVSKGVRLAQREEATAKLILENHPNGSRGMVSFRYTTGNSGHTFNWEVVDGKVIWIDAQDGSRDSSSRLFGQAKNIDVARLDNMEPMANVLRYIDGEAYQ